MITGESGALKFPSSSILLPDAVPSFFGNFGHIYLCHQCDGAHIFVFLLPTAGVLPIIYSRPPFLSVPYSLEFTPQAVTSPLPQLND